MYRSPSKTTILLEQTQWSMEATRAVSEMGQSSNKGKGREADNVDDFDTDIVSSELVTISYPPILALLPLCVPTVRRIPPPDPLATPHNTFPQAEPFGVLPPLIHIFLNTGLNYTPPTNTGGWARQWNIPVNSQWPVKIPKDHQVSAYAVFFVLIFMDWNLAFGERPTLRSHQRLYDEHHQILKNFLDSVQLIKNGVDHHSSVKSTVAKDFPNKNGPQLEQVIIWEILMLSPKPMTAKEIATALSERKTLAFVGSRWQQLVDLVGAEEIYFCVYRPGGFKTKLQGLDIVHVALSGDDAAFQRLKSEIQSSHKWLKEICLGLKGVLSMVKMAATTSDNMMKAQMGLQIQERVREVFGPINVTEFNKSMGLLLGGTDPTASRPVLTTPRHNNGQDTLAEATVSTASIPAIATNSTHESLPSDPSAVSEDRLAATATTVPAPRNENRQNEAPAVGRGAAEGMYRVVSPKILPQKTYLSILVAQYDGQSLRNDISGEYRLTTLQVCKRKSNS